MFIKISEKDDKLFNSCGVHWAGNGRSEDGSYDIHKFWLDKTVKSGLVKNYSVNGKGFATIEFHKMPELFKVYKKTIINEANRGVVIRFNSALDELQIHGYDGYNLDFTNDLYGEYLDDYLLAMTAIHNIKSKILLFGGK
jgi:hypothetical protein